MAHLNVRENRIEATIAYVGPELAGKATNFMQLQQEPHGGAQKRRAPELLVGQLMKLDYRPQMIDKVDEREISLELLAAHGPTPVHAQRDLVEAADGVVFVVDSDPGALARNRGMFDGLRDVLREQHARGRPVVIQLNKRDLSHALSPSELAAALELHDFPTVLASAKKGDGVTGTVHRVIAGLAGALHAPLPSALKTSALVQPPRSEGNPLLASLRQLMRETVREHVELLGKELRGQIDARLVPLEHLLKAAAEGEGIDGGEAARTRACLDYLKERAVENQNALSALQSTMETLARDLRGKKSRGGG